MEIKDPYYWKWIGWCWRRPIWIGLPLVVICVPVAAVDTAITLIKLVKDWGKPVNLE